MSASNKLQSQFLILSHGDGPLQKFYSKGSQRSGSTAYCNGQQFGCNVHLRYDPMTGLENIEIFLTSKKLGKKHLVYSGQTSEVESLISMKGADALLESKYAKPPVPLAVGPGA